MKTTALLLAAALLLPTTCVFAQSSALPDVRELVGAYPTAPAAAPSAVGSVTYVGVVNSQDAQHEQFARLRQAFAQTRPTVVFFEKPDLGTDSTAAATIGRLGESGYVRFLAQQYQVPTARLDDPVAEYAYLGTRLAPEQAQLYWLLRTTQQYRQHTSASKALMMRQVQALIASGATCMPGSQLVIHNATQLKAAYRQLCPMGSQWWKLPAASFSDQPVAGRPTEPFLAAISHTVSEYRAQRLAAQVATAVQAGHRVLVVLNRDHLPASTPATFAARALTGR